MIIDGLSGFDPQKKYEPEELFDLGKVDTTIAGLDMYAPDWVEQAAEEVNAVEGNTYVKLNRGILTVTQIDALLDSIPLEFSFIDNNNQFIYYNNEKDPEDMWASSNPESVGQPLGSLHPEIITNYAKMIIQQLRAGETDVVRIGHAAADGEQFLVHNYQRMQDQDENYLGVNEYVTDLKPIIEWYLKHTKQKLVPDDDADSDFKEMPLDGISGATKKTMNHGEVDAISGASKKTP